MASSGTWDFSPSTFDLAVNAFSRIGLRGPEVTQQHWNDAAMESNLTAVHFSNLQPNLWETTIFSETLVAGVATYTLPARLICPIAVYIETDNGSVTTDRILGPLSTFEYSSIANKQTEGPPTSYWFNRQITPQMTMWPTPDDNGPYTLKVRYLSQIQDMKLPSGVTPDMPYRFMDAFTAQLSHRLARIYRPELEQSRKQDAVDAWNVAANQDTEAVPLYVIPGLSSYRW